MPRSDIISRPPGHARIVGAPRSGKTSLLVERFHHLSRAGHQPLVIAFGREQRDRLLERLIPAGTARFGSMPVTTHGLLATRLVSSARPDRGRALRDVDELIVLDRVLAARPDVLRSDLRSIAFSSTLRDELLRILHLLAQNGLTPEQAEAAAGKSDDVRARDVLHLFAAYQAYLRGRGMVTFYDAAWEAAHLVTRDAALAAQAGVRDVLLVDDAHDLDAGQFALLRALAPEDGRVALELFGDPTGPRFSFRGTSDRFFAEEFPAVYRPQEFMLAPPRPADAALAACIDALRGATPAPERDAVGLCSLPLFASAPTTPGTSPVVEWNVRVHAVRARDEVAEAHHAARCVREWIQRGIAPGEIAIVARDPERVASLVNHAFRERDVPIDTGSRADSAADTFVHALVGALGRDGDGRFAEALESSPLLAAFCAGRGGLPDVARTVAALRSAHSSRDGFDLERLLRDHVAAVAPSGAIDGVAGEWNRYAEVVTRTGGHPSLDEFRSAYLEAARRETGGDAAVQLVAARAMSGRTVRAAVVLGCADGLFPRVEVESGYLPFASLSFALSGVHRGAARDLAGRIDRDRAEREETALLVSTLLCARDEICISHPLRSGDQALGVSPALAPLFASATDAQRDSAAAFRASSLVARTAPDSALAGAAAVADSMAGGWIQPPGKPRRPVFDELPLSPSRLDTFTGCERKFFFQRVLRIEDPGNIYLTIGGLFHDVLRQLVPVGANGDDVCAALASGATDAVIDSAISAAMPEAGDWVRALTKVHMRHMLDGVIALEKSRTGSYRVIATETSADYPTAGARILTGRVDRIDHVDGLGAVVVDYKTSKQLPAHAAKIIEGIEDERAHWQIIIYSALAAAMGHEAHGFLYYVVPPGEPVNAVGVQLQPGRLVEVVQTPPGKRPRYEALDHATVQSVLDEAMKIHDAILTGACAYARTHDRDKCRICNFIRVCRRNAE